MEKIKSRSLYFTKVSVPWNLLLATIKFILGIMSFSFFLIIGGLYNLGISIAKYFALEGNRIIDLESSENIINRKQRQYYNLIGIIIFISSIIFILYSVRLFFINGTNLKYTKIRALIIATVTFVEIIFAIRGIVIARKIKEPIVEAIKLTNLSTSLVSLVVTQSAILSFTHKQNLNIYNGVLGFLMGSLSLLIGMYMIIRDPNTESFWIKIRNKLIKGV